MIQIMMENYKTMEEMDMANNKIWSDEKKQYIVSLVGNKRILFAKVNSFSRAQWDEENDDYDIIIGYDNTNDFYYACDARLHRGKKSASFDCPEFKIKKISDICVGYRKIADERTLYERVLKIPCKKLEEFCKKYSYYMTCYMEANDPILMGVYDVKSQSIIQLRKKSKKK